MLKLSIPEKCQWAGLQFPMLYYYRKKLERQLKELKLGNELRASSSIQDDLELYVPYCISKRTELTSSNF